MLQNKIVSAATGHILSANEVLVRRIHLIRTWVTHNASCSPDQETRLE